MNRDPVGPPLLVISKFNRSGVVALICFSFLCGTLGSVGLWGVFGNLDGDGRLVPIQTGLLFVSSAAILWACVQSASSLIAPGSVYARGGCLYVGRLIQSSFPLQEVVGFSDEPAPTSLFKENKVLFIERANGKRARVDSALNEVSIGQIRKIIASLR